MGGFVAGAARHSAGIRRAGLSTCCPHRPCTTGTGSAAPLPPVHHVSWPQDHVLADLLAVWFGRFGDDDAGQADRAAFEAIAQGCPLGPGLPLPPWPMSMASQLGITMQDVYQQPRWQTQGVVVIEHENVSHLVSFWNLRAAGQEVFPWVESHADLLEEPLRQWLDRWCRAAPELQAAARLSRLASARSRISSPPRRAHRRRPFPAHAGAA